MARGGWLGAGFVLGTALGLPVEPALALAAGLVALAGWLVGRRAAWLALAGAALGALAVAGMPAGPRLRGPVALVGVVISSPVGDVADVAVSRWRPVGGAWQEALGRVRVDFGDARVPVPGAEVAVMGEGVELRQHGPPGSPDLVRAARLSRLRTVVEAWDARRLGGDPAPPRRVVPGLLRAIVLGDRSDVDPELLQLMRDTGTAHLLAVSGSNVGLAALIAVVAVRALLGLYAQLRPEGASGPWLMAAALVGAIGFTWLVGLPTSAQRAMVGASFVAVAAASGRRVEPYDAIGAAAIGVALVDPSAVTQASFHLSFGAVLGLATWGRTLDARVPATWPGWLREPARLLVASTAATLGTLPASAWWFQSIAPLGVLANLFAVPWTTFVLTPCAFGALLGPDLVAGVAIAIGEWGTGVQQWVLGWCAVPPWHPAVGPAGAVVLVVAMACHQRPALAALLTAAALYLPTDLLAPPALRVVLFDVGQGASTLIVHPDGARWLIDGGPPRSGVTDGLRRMGVRHLHRVIATHGDLDHVGGLERVLGELSVDELHVAGTDGLETAIMLAEAQGARVIDDPALRLHPVIDVAPGRNEDGIVLQVGDPCQVLLMADVSTEVEEELLPRLGPCELLQVGHHGSRTSTGDALLGMVEPDLALVPVGEANMYGHPSPDTLARLAAREVPVLRTDVHGTLELVRDAAGWRWRAHRYGEGWTGWTTVEPRRRWGPVSP